MPAELLKIRSEEACMLLSIAWPVPRFERILFHFDGSQSEFGAIGCVWHIEEAVT